MNIKGKHWTEEEEETGDEKREKTTSTCVLPDERWFEKKRKTKRETKRILCERPKHSNKTMKHNKTWNYQIKVMETSLEIYVRYKWLWTYLYTCVYIEM